MTISDKDMFLAILSMDSYDRGYAPGITLTGNAIGSATVSDDRYLPQGSVAAGFYAAAYDTEWGTVISYRGTDANLVAPWSDDPGSDAWNGYGLSIGSTINDQARMAAEFFQAVTGTQTLDPRDANVTLTGHSLGGGLAEVISLLAGAELPFSACAQ